MLKNILNSFLLLSSRQQLRASPSIMGSTSRPPSFLVAQLSSSSKARLSRRSIWFKTFVIAEVGALLVSYALWHQMNTSQEYRYYIKNNIPSLLEGKNY